MAVTMKNVIIWDVSPCDSCRNMRFGRSYRPHLQGENNQRAKITIPIAHDCSTLRRINHYMKKGSNPMGYTTRRTGENACATASVVVYSVTADMVAVASCWMLLNVTYMVN
jgi:hypothetical protein